MEKEQLFEKRMIELSKNAYYRGILTFSDFLDLNELHKLHSLPLKQYGVKVETFGGHAFAERQMAAFIPDALLFQWSFPIACLRIRPLNKKFAEKLTHRDCLGAVLNLGIDRSKTGDILTGEDCCWMFCTESMADFICQELTRVRHTSVMCERCSPDEIQAGIHTEEVTGTVSSVRLDSVLAVACKASRSSLVSAIEEGKVFVNGRLVTSNGYSLKEGDLISLRGTGRFRFLEVGNQSKKGRYFIKVERYQ